MSPFALENAAVSFLLPREGRGGATFRKGCALNSGRRWKAVSAEGEATAGALPGEAGHHGCCSGPGACRPLPATTSAPRCSGLILAVPAPAGRPYSVSAACVNLTLLRQEDRVN